jgi:hypothetical protein
MFNLNLSVSISLVFTAFALPLLGFSNAASAFEAEIRADGTAQSFKLVGRDGYDGRQGADGRAGRDGFDAYCRDRKSRAENGGDGEDGQNGAAGGNGEDGRDGGDSIIQFEDVNLLKLISINARGGLGGYGARGGYGGQGGRGGWGCNGGWRGRDGRDGYSGPNASDGREGSRGKIYIKKGFDARPSSVTQISLPIRDFFSKTLTLRKNFWLEKSGAAELLAPRSVVADVYSEYQSTSTITATGVLNWNEKPSETVLNQVISVEYRAPFTEPTIEFGGDKIIVFFSRDQQGSHFIYKIDSIYNSDDFFHFKAGIRGEIGTDRRILISDLKTNWGALSSELTVITQQSGSSKSYPVPASAIRKSPYGPEIVISKVPSLKGKEGASFDKVLVNMKRNLKGRIIQRNFEVKGSSL